MKVRTENMYMYISRYIPYFLCRPFNSLETALFCCKFNLVDTDQFSCEYLVWVLCYCSQTDVLFPPLGSCTCPYPNAPPIAGVKPEMFFCKGALVNYALLVIQLSELFTYQNKFTRPMATGVWISEDLL